MIRYCAIVTQSFTLRHNGVPIPFTAGEVLSVHEDTEIGPHVVLDGITLPIPPGFYQEIPTGPIGGQTGVGVGDSKGTYSCQLCGSSHPDLTVCPFLRRAQDLVTVASEARREYADLMAQLRVHRESYGWKGKTSLPTGARWPDLRQELP